MLFEFRRATVALLTTSGILLLLAAGLASGQSPVFRSDTRVVEVAVVAKSGDGSPVSDLHQRDFRLFDNTAEQTLLSFENLGVARLTLNANNASTTARDRPTLRRSIIVLDELNTSLAGRVNERKAISEMLRSLPPGEDRIAIFALGDTLHLLHDFSTDIVSLRASVDTYEGERPATGLGERNPFSGGFSLAAPRPTQDADSYAELRLSRTLEAFTELARNMSNVPGEKNLLWLTAGFAPPEDRRDVEAATRALKAARMTMYPIDARGLLTCPPTGCPPEINLNIATMEDFAQQTGGRAFHDDNGLSTLARAALDDSREGYILTYSPNNYLQDGSAHTVQLKVARKSLDLRYRSGYLAE